MEGVIAKFIVEAVAAAALLAGFLLFLRGLRDQRTTFETMMSAQSNQLESVIERQSKSIDAHTEKDHESHLQLANVISQNTAALAKCMLVIEQATRAQKDEP